MLKIQKQISQELRLGYKTAYKELNILWNMEILLRKTKEYGFKESHEWRLNGDNLFVKSFLKGQIYTQEEVCKKCGLKTHLINGLCDLCYEDKEVVING